MPLSFLIDVFQTGLNSLQKLESRAMRRREASHQLVGPVAAGNDTADIDAEQASYNQALQSGNSFTVFDTYDAYKVREPSGVATGRDRGVFSYQSFF